MRSRIVRRHAGTVVAHDDLRAPVRRAARQQLQIQLDAAAACKCIGGKVQYRGHERRRIGAHHQVRRLRADGQADSFAQRRAQPLGHLFQQRAHADRLARGAAMREGQHVVDQLVELFEAGDGFLGAAGQVRRAAIRTASSARRTATPRRAACGSDAPARPPTRPASAGVAGAPASTCIRCDSVTSVSSTTSPPLSSSRRETLTNRPLRSSVCSPGLAGLTRRARAARPRRAAASSGSPSSSTRRRIALLNQAARVEHQDAPRQARRSTPTGAPQGAPCRHEPRPDRRASCATCPRSESNAPDNWSETDPKARNAPVSSERRFSISSRFVAAMPEKKATSVPRRYLLRLSTGYELSRGPPRRRRQ